MQFYCKYFLCFIFIYQLQAQHKQIISRTIKKSDSVEISHKRKVSYVFENTMSPIVKYNPVSLLFGGSLYFYQKIVSPQIKAECSHELSCSNFSKTAIKTYGLFKGVAMSADRLTRCTKLGVKDISLIVINKQNKIIDSVSFYR